MQNNTLKNISCYKRKVESRDIFQWDIVDSQVLISLAITAAKSDVVT